MDLFIDVSSLERLYLDVVSNLPPTSTYCKYASDGRASRRFGPASARSELQHGRMPVDKRIIRAYVPRIMMNGPVGGRQPVRFLGRSFRSLLHGSGNGGEGTMPERPGPRTISGGG